LDTQVHFPVTEPYADTFVAYNRRDAMPFQIQEIIELLGYKRSRNDLRHAI
jgi:hypothetical protein